MKPDPRHAAPQRAPHSDVRRGAEAKPELRPSAPLHRESLLLVDSSPMGGRRLRSLMQRFGARVELAVTAREAIARLADAPPDLILASLDLDDLPGAGSIDLLRQRAPETPVVAIAEDPSVDGAVEALRRGAADYIGRGAAPEQLFAALQRALHEARARSNRDVARARQQVRERYGLDHMLTRSPLMLRVFDQIRAVAGTDATVLIRGETGTGKELISQAIHSRSRRKEYPFIAINCGAFSETLLESELFGHEKGSFTSADRRRRGVFEMADSGTLFLDELGETSLNVQVSLLRVLEDMTFRRVGGVESIQVDVRIVAATNVGLEDAVTNGAFRQDLFYRLNVFPIFLPALRERREDIPLLMRHFLEDAAEEYQLDPPVITTEAMSAILAYPWPGNVRQLRALCERWTITHAGKRLELEGLPRELNGLSSAPVSGGAIEVDERCTLAENLDRSNQRIERAYLHALLRRHDAHMERTAEAAGISRRTLYTKMKRYGLIASDYR